jgi:cytochrome oxidase assembly protein ShyY1
VASDGRPAAYPRRVSGYGFLRERRWLTLGFVVLILVPSFLLLSRWQIHRLDDRRAANALVEQNNAAAPVPVGQVLTAGAPLSSVGDAQEWRQVTATGTYDASRQVLVRKRPLDGHNGFWVVTPLVTSSGVLVVNRGWIASSVGATDTQPAPAPPTGEVTVTGRVRPSEAAPHPQPSDLPGDQITDLDVSLVAQGGEVYPGYIELTASQPQQSGDLTLLPLPDLSEGPHLSYAIQWVLFAGVAVVGFVVLARREKEMFATESAGSAHDSPEQPSDTVTRTDAR